MARIRVTIARRIIGPLAIAVLAGLGAIGAAVVSAATPAGITVSPATVNATLNQKEPQQTIALGVRNDFESPVNLVASLQGIDQQTGLLVPTEQVPPELAQAVQINPSAFSLQPKDSINIQLIITDSPALAPGGHYAALLIRQIAEAGKRVGLQPAISVTVFILKEGGALRSLQLQNITLHRTLLSFPRSADLVFLNKGNVHLVPRAALTATNSNGSKTYSQGTVNEQSLPLLPKETIRLRAEIAAVKKPWLPGRYTLNVQYRYDGAAVSQLSVVRFWYLPLPYLLLAIVLFGLVYRRHLKRQARRQLSNLAKVVVRPRKNAGRQ